MASVLIQGGSRGLGLQFCKTLASRSEVSQIVVTSRKAQDELSLLKVKNVYPEKISLVNLDVRREVGIKDKLALISKIVNGKLD